MARHALSCSNLQRDDDDVVRGHSQCRKLALGNKLEPERHSKQGLAVGSRRGQGAVLGSKPVRGLGSKLAQVLGSMSAPKHKPVPARSTDCDRGDDVPLRQRGRT